MKSERKREDKHAKLKKSDDFSCIFSRQNTSWTCRNILSSMHLPYKSFLHAFFIISLNIFQKQNPAICVSTLVLNNTYKIYPFEFPKTKKELNFFLLDSLKVKSPVCISLEGWYVRLAYMKNPHVVSVPHSILLIESTRSQVMVHDTANLKKFLHGLPNIKLSYI